MKNLINQTSLNLLLILYLMQAASLFAQPASLPLMQISDLKYQGAFAIPSTQPDQLSANYGTSTIAFNSVNGSLFLSGFANAGIIAEFSIPSLSNSTNVSALNQATILQNFSAVLNQASNGNPQAIDRITGMALINGKLIINGEEFYDAPANNTNTTLVLQNPSNLASSAVTGYYSLNGAAHAAGWISPVPDEWQSLLGGSYIAGNSSKYSINARLPMGITAFAFNPSNLNGNPSAVSTTTLLDFSLSSPLYAGYNSYADANYNLVQINGDNSFAGHTAADAKVVVGSNNLWTEESQASYGFIVPGTRTYLTIGSSGGHNSGIGYKPTQNNGYECPGPCPYDNNDYYNYYWLWDVNDLLAVKNGSLNPYDVRPYDYGVFNTPFQTDAYTGAAEFHPIKGGTYDANKGILYLALEDGGSTGAYDKVPVILAYSLSGDDNNCPAAGTACNDGDSNTTNDVEDGFCNCAGTLVNPPSAECDDIMNTLHGYALQAGVTGGDGMANYVVENTNNSGAGSYRDALSQSNRYITFNTSLANQRINLNSPVITSASNITVDGSDAPGITISKFATKFEGNNIIVAYMNYHDMDGAFDEDGITFRNATARGQAFYVYKCHFKNAADGNIDVIWNRGNDVYFTISHCKFEQTDKCFLVHSGEDAAEGGTYYGTLDHNWFYRVGQRAPFGRSFNLHYYNNLLEHWGDANNAGGGAYSGDNSKFLVENNIAIAASPGDLDYSGTPIISPKQKAFAPQFTSTTGAIKNSANLYINDAFGLQQLASTVPTPTYNYTLKTANAQLETYVRDNANAICDNNCSTAGQICDDGDDCTTGETFDADCNCTGGRSQDADNDGICVELDPDDNDPCIPNSCEEEDCELLVNTDFDNGLSPWEYWGANDVSVVDGVANIKDIETVANRWDVGFTQSQRNITLVQGESYTLTFRASADANRPVYLYIGMENAPWTAYHLDSYTLTPTMQEFTATFTMTDATDTNIRFDFNLGGNTTNTYIDYADLRKADCETSCSREGQRCDDGDDCTTGETYDANCNCTGGRIQDADQDGVCAADDPDDNDPCVPNPCNEDECELLTNTNFDNDLANWDYWECDASSVNGMATLTNISNGQNVWNAAFYTDNILIEQGASYEVNFSARADANRTMDVKVGQNDEPYLNDIYQTFNLTTNMQNFTMNFTMNRPTDNNTAFDFFIAGGNTTNIYIDNVSLKKLNCGIQPPPPPPPPPPSGQCDCPDVSQPGNTVTVSNVSQLQNAVSQASNQGGNMTIKVEPGTYQLSSGFVINSNMSNLTIMGTTGNRDDVIIKGQGYNGGVPFVFLVQADNFTAANMTIGEVSTHAIQIQSEQDADDFTAINVRFVDVKEQLLKVSAGASTFSDRGRVMCCAFEFTAGIAYQFYTGGIDAHKSKDWIVQNNTFEGIRSPDGTVAEHAIHFWRDCEGTTVIGNQIERCDRGIGFGLGNAFENGHRGGLIMNNFVHTNRDVGIGLEYASNIKVYNNTVITDNYPRSIEYRFSGTTNVQIINNLVSGEISDRGEGASGNLSTNYTVSDFNIFADAGNYDYHLAGTPSGIVDAGTSLNEVTVDIDCDSRTSGAGLDIGADEVTRFAKEQLLADSFFTIQPNPANHSIQLDCEIAENTQAQIGIYDAFGKLHKQISNVELAKGAPTEVEVSQLPAGVYFCKIQASETEAVKKFVIAR